MAVSYPLWYTLKANIKTFLEAIATEENAVDTGRNFLVSMDRWNPWIESQQGVALANILTQTVALNTDRSGSRRNGLDNITVIVDMYALGKPKVDGLLPGDEIAAKRLDLLVAQVREGLTRLNDNDFGFAKDSTGGFLIDRDINFTLTYYDQESAEASGQYAPARWTFNVMMPFIPEDKRTYYDLDVLNLSVKKDDLENFALQFTYDS
jgi:hypothetical protein